MNFCKDCRHKVVEPDRNDDRFAKCGLSPNEYFPVIGREPNALNYCSVERVSDSPKRCGPDARFFELVERYAVAA